MPISITKQDRWYFQPRFFVKVLWGIFSAAILVIIGIFAPKVHDPFWTAVVNSSAPFLILITILVLFMIVLAVTLVTYFVAAVAPFKKWLLFAAIGVSALDIILMFAFLGKWGTISRRSHYIVEASKYFGASCLGDQHGAGCDWFRKNILHGREEEFADMIYEYTDERTEDIGSSLLGCFLVWALFYGIWLGLLFTERDQPDCCSSERDGYTQQKE